jgi:hypothetical protein
MEEAKSVLAEALRVNPKLTVKILTERGAVPPAFVDRLRRAGLRRSESAPAALARRTAGLLAHRTFAIGHSRPASVEVGSRWLALGMSQRAESAPTRAISRRPSAQIAVIANRAVNESNRRREER